MSFTLWHSQTNFQLFLVGISVYTMTTDLAICSLFVTRPVLLVSMYSGKLLLQDKIWKTEQQFLPQFSVQIEKKRRPSSNWSLLIARAFIAIPSTLSRPGAFPIDVLAPIVFNSSAVISRKLLQSSAFGQVIWECFGDNVSTIVSRRSGVELRHNSTW